MHIILKMQQWIIIFEVERPRNVYWSAKMLAREGVLTCTRPDVYQYEEQQHEEYEGIYKGYRKSYGFIIMLDDEDIYVAEQNKGTAMHNDKVRVA